MHRYLNVGTEIKKIITRIGRHVRIFNFHFIFHLTFEVVSLIKMSSEMLGECPPPLIDDENQDNSEDGEDFDEAPMDFCEEECKDLFSDKTFRTPTECLEYCKKEYGFDVSILQKRHGMDCFSFIRLVNYIRKERPKPEFVMTLNSDDLWKNDDFMKPVSILLTCCIASSGY